MVILCFQLDFGVGPQQPAVSRMVVRARLPLVFFFGYWIAGVVYMTWTHLADPPGPYSVYAGELARMLWFTSAEVLILAVVIRPWSYHRSWTRALGALGLLTPWLAAWMFLGMYSGPTTGVHYMILVLFWLCLLVATVVSFIGTIPAR